MKFPKDRLYTEYHLWIKQQADGALIGITEYAARELGDVDYVELPEPDDDLTKNVPFGIIETSKAVTDLVAPISGSVIESNPEVIATPRLLTQDPYRDGWLVKVMPAPEEDFADLIQPKDYQSLVDAEIEASYPATH